VEPLLTCGVLSVMFSLASTVIYLREVQTGSVRPHR